MSEIKTLDELIDIFWKMHGTAARGRSISPEVFASLARGLEALKANPPAAGPGAMERLRDLTEDQPSPDVNPTYTWKNAFVSAWNTIDTIKNLYEFKDSSSTMSTILSWLDHVMDEESAAVDE